MCCIRHTGAPIMISNTSSVQTSRINIWTMESFSVAVGEGGGGLSEGVEEVCFVSAFSLIHYPSDLKTGHFFDVIW